MVGEDGQETVREPGLIHDTVHTPWTSASSAEKQRVWNELCELHQSSVCTARRSRIDLRPLQKTQIGIFMKAKLAADLKFILTNSKYKTDRDSSFQKEKNEAYHFVSEFPMLWSFPLSSLVTLFSSYFLFPVTMVILSPTPSWPFWWASNFTPFTGTEH